MMLIEIMKCLLFLRKNSHDTVTYRIVNPSVATRCILIGIKTTSNSKLCTQKQPMYSCILVHLVKILNTSVVEKRINNGKLW